MQKYNSSNHQKQHSRDVLRKRCSENMQQIYRRTLMPKCDFNKVAKATKAIVLFVSTKQIFFLKKIVLFVSMKAF